MTLYIDHLLQDNFGANLGTDLGVNLVANLPIHMQSGVLWLIE